MAKNINGKKYQWQKIPMANKMMAKDTNAKNYQWQNIPMAKHTKIPIAKDTNAINILMPKVFNARKYQCQKTPIPKNAIAKKIQCMPPPSTKLEASLPKSFNHLCFSFWMRFSNMCCPGRAGQKTSPNDKNRENGSYR